MKGGRFQLKRSYFFVSKRPATPFLKQESFFEKSDIQIIYEMKKRGYYAKNAPKMQQDFLRILQMKAVGRRIFSNQSLAIIDKNKAKNSGSAKTLCWNIKKNSFLA
ncbi:MAG: hypothetical protein HFE84_00935 [Lachnospiraceae bacterium]|nr:hypothetical protein [Lachnospiraceae bacterium]